MRQIKFALAFALGLLPLAALGQSAPANLPYHTVYGRLGATPGDTGPGQAIPFANFLPVLVGAQSPNIVYAGPSSGAVALPTFRSLVGADLPVPSATTLGGVLSLTCATSNWFNTLSTSGVHGCTQPNFTDLAGSISAAQLINPTASTLGGVKSLAAVTHNFLTSIGTNGLPTQVQPACTDLSDATSSCNAANGQLPATATNDNATTGKLGEYLESVVLAGSAVSNTTSVAKDITSLSLTAGDWDCTGNVATVLQASTAQTALVGWVSTASATLPTLPNNGSEVLLSYSVTGANSAVPVGTKRFSLSATTAVFLSDFITFTVNTVASYGALRCRRVR